MKLKRYLNLLLQPQAKVSNDPAKNTILVCSVDSLPQIGGVSIMAHELANALADEGKNVVFVGKKGSYIPAGFERKYLHIEDTKYDKKARSGKNCHKEDARLVKLFGDIITHYNVERILLLHPFHYGVGAVEAGKKFDIPVSVYFHGYEIRSQLLTGYPKNPKALVENKIVGTLRERTIYTVCQASQICTNSNFTADIFDGFTTKTNNILVTGCGIARSIYDYYMNLSFDEKQGLKPASKSKLGIDPEKIVLGYIGRIVHNKNIESLIHIASQNDKFHVIIIGDGPHLDTIKQLITSLNIEHRVLFLGHVTEQEKWIALQALDYIALLSKQIEETGHVEGFGIAMLEGALAGAVPITSGTGGMLDVVEDKVTGLVCPIGQEELSAQQILACSESNDTYAQIQSNAISQIQSKFNWATIAQKLIKSWKENV